MKKKNLFPLVAMLFAAMACNTSESVVVRPAVQLAKTSTIGIDTVELTPTATIISVKA